MTATATTPTLPSIAYRPAPYTGPSRAEVFEMRKRYAHPALFYLYKDPIMIVDGHMQYLFDETGKRYLDLFAGIVTVSVGHSHPRVVKRVQEQAGRLMHTTTIYLHPNIGLFAKALAERMPPGLDVTYFVNSGSEANDLAVTMARLYTGNHDVIAVRNSYHGGSPSTMGLTSHYTWKFPTQQSAGIHHALNPDPYRSPFTGTPEEIATKSANDIRDLVRYSTPGRIAAFMCEPIAGVGGVTMGAPNYLREAYAAARENGGLCIADEVQTGFGRTGNHYWGFQNWGVTPDIVTMAKGIGNGAPLAAVTTRREIAEALTGRIHFNTYGGNPVSMAAGLGVLEAIDADGLQANSRVVGGKFKEGLKALMARHDLIGDVRGLGLMLGVELVKDRKARTPAREETLAFLEKVREQGILIGKGGLDGNVLRIKPPMCISAEDVDYALYTFDKAFKSL
ncbi:MAG TPA: aspartate aminotransferase family protein [Gemmatimonadales bacterium]|nr:aspartate aminotransferase family protein [Gemmatimonadales bacterium]